MIYTVNNNHSYAPNAIEIVISFQRIRIKLGRPVKVNYTISRYSARRLKNDLCDRMRIKSSGIHDFIRNNENRPLYGTFLA